MPTWQAFEEVAVTASKADDLLNFSIEDNPADRGFTTPPVGGRAYPLSASSSSWVEEMNAELAEFDNLTGGLLDPASGASAAGDGSASGARAGPAWEQRMEAELQAQLASPSLSGAPAAPPR